MAYKATLLALMSVIGLASCYPGLYGGYGGIVPMGTTYSQVSHHHGPYGWGGIGGLYGYGAHLPISSVSHVSHGAHYGGWGGLYGGVHVAQSPVQYHGYSMGTPHSVQTTSHSFAHGGWGTGMGSSGFALC